MTPEEHAKALLAKMVEDTLPALVKQIEKAVAQYPRGSIRLHYDIRDYDLRVEVLFGEDQAT